MRTTMYLQRHGESETNVAGLFTCRRLDPNLTSTGRRQIAGKVEFYQAAGVQRIVTSPARRAVQSAEILGSALGIGVTTDDALREVDVGALEGQSDRDPELRRVFDETLNAWLNGGANTRFPGGESKQEVETRIGTVLSLSSPTTVLVGHCALFAVLLGQNGMPFTRVEELFLPRAGTAVYSADTKLWTIRTG